MIVSVYVVVAVEIGTEERKGIEEETINVGEWIDGTLTVITDGGAEREVVMTDIPGKGPDGGLWRQ